MALGLFRRWKPDRDFVAAPLRATRIPPLRLDRFPLGVDNAHIDVLIPVDLQEAVRAWVAGLVREEVHRGFWHDGEARPDREAAELLRSRYLAAGRTVVQETRRRARQEWVQLYMLAMLKSLLAEVDRALGELREAVEHERSEAGARVSGRALTLHERLVSLSRHHGLVRYRCAQQVLRQWARLEQTSLRKLRETVLGVAWPVSETLLFNPLFALGGLGVDESFLQHYALVLRDPASCDQVQQVILETLGDWLPDGVVAGRGIETSNEPTPRGRVEQGSLPGYVDVERRLRQLVGTSELSSKVQNWFDDPDNLAVLLGGRDTGAPVAGPWRHAQWQRQQARMIGALISRLRRTGLLHRAAASYVLVETFPATGLKDSAATLLDFLAGDLNRHQLQRRLESAAGGLDSARLVKQAQLAARQVKRALSGDGARQVALRLACDLARLRRDLKLSWLGYRAMDAMRLLGDPQEITLSRANGLLQNFEQGAVQTGDADIIGHVILKADVRGSTGITALMRDRNLNPAAYFSRNLYGPINALLKRYGASKVFVEGDAVILMLLERHDMQLAVARACGLARKILGVIQAKNAESRRHGLPELEIGLGIAYSDEPPTYLYDEGHRITISPAINRADQLSSCHPTTKALDSPVLRASLGLEVIHPVSQGRQPTKDMEDLLRYNANGIELDAPAFQRLKGELTLEERTPGEDAPPGRYHVGRFHDAAGTAHWLVVRETPLWLLVGNELIPGDEQGRCFYEVVSNPELIQRVLLATSSELAQLP